MADCPSCLWTIASLAPTWQKLGKRRGCLSVPSALSLLLLPAFPILESQPLTFWTDNSHTMFIITMFAAVHLGTGSSESCCPPQCCALSWWRKSKGTESFHERHSKGLTLYFNLLLSQICWESGVLFHRCVALSGECSAGFLFEM